MQNKIKELRQKIGITQEELARRVNIKRETIIFLEQGKYNPSLRLAMKIAKEFKIKAEDLFVI
jgi:putative transcriptional regulator